MNFEIILAFTKLTQSQCSFQELQNMNLQIALKKKLKIHLTTSHFSNCIKHFVMRAYEQQNLETSHAISLLAVFEKKISP